MTRLRTSLCDALGIEVPIIQAPVGTAACPELAAAVSNAGGLGMLALTWHEPEGVRAAIRKTRALTSRPFGVNLVLIADHTGRMRICREEGVRIMSFFWGDPAVLIAQAHEAGALVMQTVASAAQASQARANGVDILVAQGGEAGGHIRGEVASMPLIPQVVDAAAGLPVVAAGGIADGRGMAAALALGAAGVWVGTRFVASEESAAHPEYKARLVAARDTDTVRTGLFDIGWPDAPHRVLRNSTFDVWEAAGSPPAPGRPAEGETIARRPDGEPIVRYGIALPRRGMTGDLEAMPLYAGQGVGLVREVLPAAEIVRRMTAEAQRALRQAML